MIANKKRDTVPELRIRSALHRLGVRFRVNVRILSQPPVRPDITIATGQLAIFVDGCFWHGCPEHGSQPGTNSHYWRAKIQGNCRRDQVVDIALMELGWRPVRIWEHEDPTAAAARVKTILLDEVGTRTKGLAPNRRSG